MARRTFAPRGRKIDFKQWDAAPGLIGSENADATFIGGSLAFNIPATILRWRSHVACMFDETRAVGDRAVFTFGVGIFSTDAVTLGSTALPDPAGEPEYPWVWWKEFRLDCFAVHAGANVNDAGWGPTQQRYDLDSKAMRKIKPGESLLIVGQMSNQAGAPVTLVDLGQLRVLIGT